MRFPPSLITCLFLSISFLLVDLNIVLHQHFLLVFLWLIHTPVLHCDVTWTCATVPEAMFWNTVSLFFKKNSHHFLWVLHFTPHLFPSPINENLSHHTNFGRIPIMEESDHADKKKMVLLIESGKFWEIYQKHNKMRYYSLFEKQIKINKLTGNREKLDDKMQLRKIKYNVFKMRLLEWHQYFISNLLIQVVKAWRKKKSFFPLFWPTGSREKTLMLSWVSSEEAWIFMLWC